MTTDTNPNDDTAPVVPAVYRAEQRKHALDEITAHLDPIGLGALVANDDTKPRSVTLADGTVVTRS